MRNITAATLGLVFGHIPDTMPEENWQSRRTSGKFFRIQVNSEPPIIVDLESNVILPTTVTVFYRNNSKKLYSLFTTEDGQRWEYKQKQ